MKKIKKSMAIILAIIMTLSSLPVAGLTAFANEADEPVFISEKTIDPIVPEGYYFTGKTNIDKDGVAIYQIDAMDSEIVLPIDLWIYADGRSAQNPDVLPAYPDTDSDGEPDVMGTENLPAAYDSRTHGYITPVENQIGGSCWAHTAAACVEANYIKKGYGNTIDLSEYHIVWYGKNGYFKNNTDSLNDGYEVKNEASILGTGGNTTDISNALLNFAGGALESSFPFVSTTETDLLSEMKEVFTYDTKYVSDAVVESIKSVDYYYFKNIPGTLTFQYDKDSPRIEYVKQAILDYGAAFFTYNSDNLYYTFGETTAYYNPNNIVTNHAITVVGWDDNFSKENFGNEKPNNNGAWLVKNSWGTSWGDDGYFWLSYEDKTIHGTVSVFDVADKEDFEEVYMYDGIGYAVPVYANYGVLSAANVFEAEGDIYLTKVSYGSLSNSDYTLKIYANLPETCVDPTAGALIYTQSGTTDNSRYIDINGDVKIANGTKFSVVLEMSELFFEGSSTENQEEYNRYNANPGESFYKLGNGVWEDTTNSIDFSGTPYILNNSCIRAIAKYDVSEGNYKVTFKDGIKYNEVMISEGSTITLPERLGYTYVFTYNGEPFTGKNISHDITVETHCYLTIGTYSEKSKCIIEYRCVYCDKEVKEAVAKHNFKSTVVSATTKNIGYTEHICTACAEGYYSDYKLLEGSVGGEVGNYWWQYADGCLSIMGDGELPDYTSTDAKPWDSYKNSITEVNVMGEVTALGSYFFSGLSKMKTITLPDTVEEIGECCFYNTAALEKFDCPKNLLTIGYHCFSYSGITEFNNNSVLSTIGEEAFMQCTKLTEVTIPGSVKTIGETPYVNCHALKKIIVEEGVTKIWNLIWGTTSFEELVIPSTVTSLSLLNFNRGEKFIVSKDNPVYCDVDGIVFTKDMKTLVAYPPSKEDLYYKMPESVTNIKQGAISHLSVLKYLDMSDCKVTTIALKRFNQVRSLTNVILPKGITRIEANAFYSTSMKNIYVPSTVTTVEANAFVSNGQSSYTIPTFYTDSENSAIKTWADSMGYTCNILHTEHNFNTVISEMTIAPSCNSDGTSLNTCVCGDFEYKTIPATEEHDLVPGETIDPTCIEDGYTIYVCATCGIKQNKDIVLTSGHAYTNWVNTTDPTCVLSGEKTRTCETCSNTETEEVPATGHSYNKVVTAPTCTEAGYTTYTCHCGDTYKDNEVAALGHSYGDWNQKVAPTCTDKGTEEKICATCGNTETQEVSATGHSYEETVIPPTCTEAGYTTYTCHCGDTYTADEVAALRHSYGDWNQIVDPSCLDKGTKQRVCATCGNKETEEVSATGHSYEETVIPPTCTEAGYTTYTCHCGDVYTADEVEALGHSYGKWNQKVAPTCTDKGTEERTCGVCGDVEKQDVSATGHSYNKTVVDPTCTEKGYTKYTCHCGDTYKEDIVATGHSYAYVNKKDPTCTEAGYEAYEYCKVCTYTTYKEIAATGHSYSSDVTAPTCTDKGYTTYKCTCGYGYTADEVSALGHTFSDWTQTKAPTCSVKGEESRSCGVCGKNETREVATIAHTYDKTVTAPTCTDKGYTTYKCTCGYGYTADEVSALGHTFSDWTQTKAPTCSVKGEESRSCGVCGKNETREVATIAHRYSSEVTAPTCTTKGYTTYKCACGYSYTADEVPANGHNYSAWTQTKAPTCSVKGEESRSCTVCGKNETKEVATIAHTYSSEVTAPTCTDKGYTTYKCVCGYSYTADVVVALGHADRNADGLCDNCGKAVDCSCNCHKTGFMGFIWKIILFFNKLFKTNKTCACGVAHY